MESIEVKEVVIQREYSEAELLVNIVALHIPAKITSSTLNLLCNKVPLGDFGLLHCKRVRKIAEDSSHVHMLLCPEYHIDSLTGEAKTLYDSYPRLVLPVPKVAPELTKEFHDWLIYWPLNFHPGERDRQQVKGLTSDEIDNIRKHSLSLLQDDTKLQARLTTLTDTSSPTVSGGLVVNPINNEVVCTSCDAIDFLEQLHQGYSFMQHPILTPTMLCIDHVAHISRRAAVGKEKLPDSDYLCTGLDLYLMEEPDLMSSMALVHSRIRRVFFVRSSSPAGALLSGNGHIHSLKALNHHYRVFQLHNLPVITTET